MTTMIEDEHKYFEWSEIAKAIAELDKRVDDLKSGKVKGITWEEAKNNILELKNE